MRTPSPWLVSIAVLCVAQCCQCAPRVLKGAPGQRPQPQFNRQNNGLSSLAQSQPQPHSAQQNAPTPGQTQNTSPEPAGTKCMTVFVVAGVVPASDAKISPKKDSPDATTSTPAPSHVLAAWNVFERAVSTGLVLQMQDDSEDVVESQQQDDRKWATHDRVEIAAGQSWDSVLDAKTSVSVSAAKHLRVECRPGPPPAALHFEEGAHSFGSEALLHCETRSTAADEVVVFRKFARVGPAGGTVLVFEAVAEKTRLVFPALSLFGGVEVSVRVARQKNAGVPTYAVEFRTATDVLRSLASSQSAVWIVTTVVVDGLTLAYEKTLLATRADAAAPWSFCVPCQPKEKDFATTSDATTFYVTVATACAGGKVVV